MIITIDRDGGLFSESVCDLINIKSQRLNTLIDQMIVPPIENKENIRQLMVTFKPITIIHEEQAYEDAEHTKPIPGGIIRRTLKIGKMENHSETIGEVNQVSLIFKEIFAETRAIIPGQPDVTAPFFVNTDFDNIAKINIAPTSTMHFRAVPLNPDEKDNPEAKTPLGSAMIIKLSSNDYNIGLKGLILDKATLPIYNFFIN